MRADPTLNPRLAARLRALLESGALTAPPVDARPLEAVALPSTISSPAPSPASW